MHLYKAYFFDVDECDQLALTIGRVMEEAGEQVEGNFDEIKTIYTQRLHRLESIINKVIFDIYSCE